MARSPSESLHTSEDFLRPARGERGRGRARARAVGAAPHAADDGGGRRLLRLQDGGRAATENAASDAITKANATMECESVKSAGARGESGAPGVVLRAPSGALNEKTG